MLDFKMLIKYVIFEQSLNNYFVFCIASLNNI
jgi:hypothetical protein